MGRAIKFEQPALFVVERVVEHYETVWHMFGQFPERKFQKILCLRVQPDPRWHAVRKLTIPAGWLSIIEGASGNMGKRKAHRPIYTGILYFSLLPSDFDPNEYANADGRTYSRPKGTYEIQRESRLFTTTSVTILGDS